MSNEYDNTLATLTKLSAQSYQHQRGEKEQARHLKEEQAIEKFNEQQAVEDTQPEKSNFHQVEFYNTQSSLGNDIESFAEQENKRKLAEKMASVYLVIEQYTDVFEYLPQLANQAKAYVTNPSYINEARNIAKRMEGNLIAIKNFLTSRVIGSLDQDPSIQDILNKHLSYISLNSFDADESWHRLNIDIKYYRLDLEQRKRERDLELKEIDEKVIRDRKKIEIQVQEKERLEYLFCGWQKIDKNGEFLPADSPVWSALLDTASGLMWVSGNSTISFPNIMNTSFGSCNIEYHLQEVNKQAWCGYNDWRLPTIQELDTISFRKDVQKRNIFFPDLKSLSSDNMIFWSSTEGQPNKMKIIFFKTGIVSQINKNQQGHIRLIRNY